MKTQTMRGNRRKARPVLPRAALSAAVAIAATLILAAGCSTSPARDQDVVQGMDALIAQISQKTVELLEADARSTLAVYYFTVEGEESGISEYLINDLTTTIANMGRDRVDVVTRQALDRILSEYSFQLSDLTEKENQVMVGRQLGADLILTGFITPVSDYFRLNAQLIQVETGVVKGGYIVSFRPERDFQRKIGGPEATSKTVTVEEEAVTRTGVATLTTLLETFDKGMSGIRLSHFEDAYGEQIRAASGEIGMEAEGAADGSPCVRFTLEAELESPYSPLAWEESYLVFYFHMETDWQPAGYQGLHISLSLQGFSYADVILQQEQNGEQVMFGLPVYLPPEEWHDLRIPFQNFYPWDRGASLDPEKPVTITVAVPYEENAYRYGFHEETRIKGAVLADDLGFFEITGGEDPGLLASFDDEISRMTVVPEVYGSLFYEDYSESDAGVLRKAQGIDSQTMAVVRMPEGPSGSYLSVQTTLTVTRDFDEFLERECCLAYYLRMQPGKDWAGFRALSFFMRSSVLSEGTLEVTGNWQGQYFYHDFALSSIWTKIEIPFGELVSGSRTLADLKGGLPQPHLMLYFDVPKDALARALEEGALEITVDMDEFVLHQ